MANFNFNKVILGGRLTADPELKTTATGVSVTSFSIAVNRRFSGKNGEDNQADFINVTAWRQTAEFITRYFRKASSICVVGTIQTRSWTDKQGQKRSGNSQRQIPVVPLIELPDIGFASRGFHKDVSFPESGTMLPYFSTRKKGGKNKKSIRNE